MVKNMYVFLMLSILDTGILYALDLVPIPTTVDVDQKKVALGKKLFLDPILSKDKKFSCISCHNLLTNGADTVAFTRGADGKLGYFNTPTVYNATYNFRQFWDGRARNLKHQALQPIVNPVEMGNTIEQALKDLKNSNTYPALFNAIFDDGITDNNLAEVLAEFGKTLITPNSKI